MSSGHDEKLKRVRDLMQREDIGTLVVSRLDNIFWLTGGDTHVGLATEQSICWLVITADRVTVVTSNIEAPRLTAEELVAVGWPVTAVAWHDGDPAAAIRAASDGCGRLAGDTPAAGRELVDLAPLRYRLTADELADYRRLGADMGAALGDVARRVQPGQAEFAVAGQLAAALFDRAITPVVLLVAADERMALYRHPLPTGRAIEQQVMLVASGRRRGLIVALTRIVGFVAPNAELRRKHEAVVKVDATLIGHTTPGTPASAIFAAGVAAYTEVGYPDEWRLHHQGGSIGYAGRDYKATFETAVKVEPNQAFAWNPSIAGTKSEDTIIATPEGPEVISGTPDWPLLEVEAAGIRVARPDLLVR